MYYAEDENFARRLQNELQAYENFNRQKKENVNPVDSELEYIDPTPSIHDLFVTFNKKYFWNSLGMVEVVWSKKMTLCAGICSFEGGKGLCKIALSAPLLSFRPRKDLVETLLHEMIHAFLFVTHNNKDRQDHGPEFCKHMFRINKEAGTNITIFHKFYNEVQYYQRYIWRCNGPCQSKKPYFGFLKRSVNRPPGPSDPWWNKHKIECGGTFVKVSEPEKRPKPKKNISKIKNKDIRNYFIKNSLQKGTQSVSNIKTLSDLKTDPQSEVKANFGTEIAAVANTEEKRQKTKRKKSKTENLKKSKENKTNGVMIVESDKEEPSTSNKTDSSSQKPSKSDNSNQIRETVRNSWANKFLNSTVPVQNDSKKLKLQCFKCNEGFTERELQSHAENCWEKQINQNFKKIAFTNEEPNGEILCESFQCPCCSKWVQASEINSHLDECLTINTLKTELLIS